jgi:HEAT repeat protein
MRLLVALLFLPSAQDLDDAAVRRLVEQLGADFLEEREAARKALEKAGKAAEGRLIEALGSSDHRVRKIGLELLTVLKSSKALERGAALFKGDEDATVRDAAFKLLQALGKEAEDSLIAALDSPNVDHRRGALQTLMEFKSVKCVPKVFDMHERESDNDIKIAARNCVKALGPAAETYLLVWLKSADAALRKESLEGLRSSKSEEVLSAVGALFAAESDVSVINAAFDQLRAAGEKAEPHFIGALKSPQEQARSRAIEGLRLLKSPRAIGPAAEVFENDAVDGVRSAAVELLKTHGLAAEGALLKALRNANGKVRLQAIGALGEIKSDKPLEEIARLYYEDKDKEVHERAFEYLRQLGPKAEKHLLAALRDEERTIQKRAILALGNAKSEAAIDPLIDFLTGVNAEAKQAAQDALVRIGPKALEVLERAVAAGKVKPAALTDILALFYQEEVERLLDHLVTEEGGSGFFEGQFREIEKFGRDKAIPVLRKIVREPGYAYRLTDRRGRVAHYELRMRELAVMALGDLGDAGAVDLLKETLKDSTVGVGDSIHEEVVVALYRLGEKQAVDEFVQKTRADAEAALKGDVKDDGCNLLFSLGLVLNRVGRRDEAAGAYRRLIQAVEEHKLAKSAEDVMPTAAYNLSCLHALKGEKGPAVEWLEKAVRAGYRDRQWIRLDRDLDSVRNEPAFLKLMSDDKLFEKKPGE